jgi:hypothetical protein
MEKDLFFFFKFYVQFLFKEFELSAGKQWRRMRLQTVKKYTWQKDGIIRQVNWFENKMFNDCD